MAQEEVFVSYSREDNDKVLALTAKLRAAGVPLWMDVRSIDGAAMWGEEIVNALDKAKVLLLMVSESAVRSHNVTKEVLLASERKGHILPVDLELTQIPPGLKYPLAGIQHIEYYHGNPTPRGDDHQTTQRTDHDRGCRTGGRRGACAGWQESGTRDRVRRSRGVAVRQHQF